MSASSAYDNDFVSYGAHRARLNLTSFAPGYRAARENPFPWIVVSLKPDKILTAMDIQGYGDKRVAEWVTQFQVMYARGKGDFIYMKDTNKQPKVSGW